LKKKFFERARGWERRKNKLPARRNVNRTEGDMMKLLVKKIVCHYCITHTIK